MPFGLCRRHQFSEQNPAITLANQQDHQLSPHIKIILTKAAELFL